MSTRTPSHSPTRQDASGKALGNLVLAVTALALVGFLLQASPGCSTETAPAEGDASGAATEGGEAPSDPNSPPIPQIDDPDEPAGAFAFELPVLPFREHSEGLPTTGTWLGYPTLADMDGDGDCDLVASNRLEDGVSTWRFDPEGPWELCIEGLPRDMSYGPTAVADLDEDGTVDLLVGDHTQALRAFLNDGDMNWIESEATWDRPYLLKDLAVADFGGDGHADVAALGHFKGALHVYQGDGAGGLRLTHTGLVPGEQDKRFGQRLALLDVDLDGVQDIAAATNVGLLVYLTRRTPEGVTFESTSGGLPNPVIGNTLFGLDAGVFDESRDAAQLVVCSFDPDDDNDAKNAIGVYAFEPDDSGGVWVQIDRGLPRTHGYKDVLSADFNADGHLDLIVCDLDGGRAIYLGDGTGGFEAAGRIVGHPKTRLTVADIDGNGYPDVVASTLGQKGMPITGKLRAFMNEPSIW